MTIFSQSELIRAASQLGISVKKRNSGHIAVTKGGRPTVFLPGTPSDRRSGVKNLGELRRNGYADLADLLSPPIPKAKLKLPDPPAPPARNGKAKQQEATVSVTEELQSGLRASIEAINADKARELLEGNTSNRNLRSGYITRLADQFVSGTMIGGVGSVILTDEGRLLEGQHRLHALISADRKKPGIVWHAVVVRGQIPEAMAVIDTGLSRRLSDFLKMERHEKYSSTLAGALTSYYRLLRRLDIDKNVWQASVPSNFACLDLLDNNPQIREAVHVISTMRARANIHFPPTLAAPMFCMMESVETGAGLSFFTALQSGMFGEDQQPLHRLREHLITTESHPDVRPYAPTRIRWATAGWNAWRSGVTIERRDITRHHHRIDMAGFTGYLD